MRNCFETKAGFVGLALLTVFLAGRLQAADTEPLLDAPAVLELAGHEALRRVIQDDENALEAFTTDGCSGGLSGTWRIVAGKLPDFGAVHGAAPPWEACCVEHDRAYHRGGSEATALAGYQSRLRADSALRSCVADSGKGSVGQLAIHYETTPEEIEIAFQSIGEAMFLAVRFGGAPCSGLPWRWGYGWPGCVVTPVDFRTGDQAPER